MGDIVSGVIGGGLGLVGNIIGSDSQSDAVKSAANSSAAASKYATDMQKWMYDKNLEIQEPWRAAGTDAVNYLRSWLLTGGMDSPLLKPYKEQQFNYQADPGYAFRLAEGQKALDRSAAAAGGLQSGSALKAALRYGQDMGSQEYGNAWNRFQADQTNKFNRYNIGQGNIYNRMAGLARTGQSTVEQLGNAGANMANNAGTISMNNAANQGNLALAQGNINSSMYQGIGNALGKAFGNTNWGNMFGGSSGYSGGSGFSWMPDSGSYNFGTGYQYDY